MGNDTFQFTHVEKGDSIADFTKGDRIDLRGIDANINSAKDQSFAFIGGSAFSGKAGELRYDGNVLYGDVNGDGVADLTVAILNQAAVTSGDLFL